MPDPRNSSSTLGGAVVHNPLPSRFSSTTIASSAGGPSPSNSSSQFFACNAPGGGPAGGSLARRPSVSVSRRGSLASSGPSQLPAVAEDGGISGATPPVPAIPPLHRSTRPGTFGLPSRDLSLVEAALSGDLSAARVALGRGELPGNRDAEGRDALLGCVAGWAVLKHFNKAIVARSNVSEDLDPLALLLELLPHPSVSLWTLNAPYPVVQTGTLLTVACWLEKVDFVRALVGEPTDDDEVAPFSALRGWVDPDGPDARGGTGLMYSAVSGQLEIAQLLLRHGARPDQMENSGLSAIWHATGRPQMTWLLEDALRKLRAKEHKDVAPACQVTARLVSLDPDLHHSMSQFTVPPPVAFFESEQHTLYGKALLRAIKASDLASLEDLLFPPAPFLTPESASSSASSPSQPGFGGKRRLGVVGLVNFVDENGLSPLHHALRVQPVPDPNAIKLLFAAGADLNLACVSRSTPLHHVACLGGASADATRRNFLVRQRREDDGGKLVSDRCRTVTTESSSSSTSRSTSAKIKAATDFRPTPAGSSLPSPARDIVAASIEANASSSELDAAVDLGPVPPQVKVDGGQEGEQEIFDLATGETESRLKEVVELMLRLGASADTCDCAGALPLHFAAEFGFSREVVRALLRDDLDQEERTLRARLVLPQSSPERVPARHRQNGLGLTPRDLCRVEFVDLFEMANEESKARRLRLLVECGDASPTLQLPEDITALNRGLDSSLASSTASLPKVVSRDSILQPLAQITSLEEAAHNLEQIYDNLLHVDKSLSSGLLLRVKEDLARQNSIHPEPDFFHSPLNDPIAEGIARLRRSFQTSSQRNASNRFRPVSVDSTQSSWWSQPSSCYNLREIASIRTELDSLYRLFTNTAHMVARVLQFYSDVLQDEDQKLLVVERHASARRADLASTAKAIEQLMRQRDALSARLEDIDSDRHNKHILSQVTDLAAAVVVLMSKQVLGAMRAGFEELDLVRHIKAAASEATKDLDQMRDDVAATGIHSHVATEAVRIIDDHLGKVRAHSADLVRSAVLPHKTLADQRKSYESPKQPSLHQSTPSTSSTPTSPSLSSFAASPTASRTRLPEAASPATTASRGGEPVSEDCASQAKSDDRSLPDWLLAARPRKEDQEEFIAASINLGEIDEDVGAVETDIQRAEEHESLVQRFIDRLPKKASNSQEADERREAFRLMSVVFQRLDVLRQRRVDLADERDATIAILQHFEADERAQDQQSRLASMLRAHLCAGTADRPARTAQFDLTDSHHTEQVSFWPAGASQAPRRDPSHAAEAAVAWDLRKVALRVEGADGLLARMTEDYRLILKAMAQNRSRCTSADRHVREAQRKLSNYLQWRMDSIIVLWEYVSADSDDDRSTFSHASSWVLDARDRLVLPDLISDPLPLRAGGGGGGESQTTGSVVDSRASSSSPPPDSPSTGDPAGAREAGTASPDDTEASDAAGTGVLELTLAKQVLRLKVHEPLKTARAEVARAVEWCEIIEGARQRLDRRLATSG